MSTITILLDHISRTAHAEATDDPKWDMKTKQYNFNKGFDGLLHINPAESQGDHASFARAVLADHVADAYLDSNLKLQQHGATAPDYIIGIAEQLQGSLPLPPQTQLDDDAKRLIRLGFALDIVQSTGFDIQPAEKQKLCAAVDGIAAALAPVLPEFDSIARESYRDLGHFDLNPFQKRIYNNWRDIDGYSTTTITGQEAFVRLRNIFSPRQSRLSPEETEVVAAMAGAEQPHTEQEILDRIIDRDAKAQLPQILASMIDAKVLKHDTDHGYQLRGQEFKNWYRLAYLPQPQRRLSGERAAAASRPTP